MQRRTVRRVFFFMWICMMLQASVTRAFILLLYMYIYIYIYVYSYIYVYIYMYTYIHTHTKGYVELYDVAASVTREFILRYPSLQKSLSVEVTLRGTHLRGVMELKEGWWEGRHTATHCNALQHTATHCNALQHTATHCNTLQHTATPQRSHGS